MIRGRQEGEPQSPGRPRDPVKGDSILAAAAEILAETGYAGLSFEAIAQRAGVSRPTIYRRYENRAGLVIDVVSVLASKELPGFDGIAPRQPNRGSLQDDLDELLTTLAASFDALSDRGIVPGFLADVISHPDLAKRFFTEHLDVAQQNVRAIFRAAAERGEISSEPLAEVVLSTLIGAYIYHRFVIAQPFGPDERRTLARLIARGLAADPAQAAE